MSERKPSVFISYSSKDKKWKDKLVRQLQIPAEQHGFGVWHDGQIQAGDDWRERISAALEATQIAALLISDEFLTSEFIKAHEVPLLLDLRKRGRVEIVPVLVGACLWQSVDWLERLELRPKGGEPLESLPVPAQKKALVQIAGEISARLTQAVKTAEEARARDALARPRGVAKASGQAAQSVAAPAELPPPRPDLPPMSQPDEERLLDALNKLLPSEFEQVLLRAGVPREHLPGGGAAQGLRVVDVIAWVRQAPSERCAALAAAMRKVGAPDPFGGVVAASPPPPTETIERRGTSGVASGLDPKHLVQVYAHTADGVGVMSTAYPIAPRLLLTARHAVRPANATGEIEVRWYNLAGDNRSWRRAAVKWEGSGDVDAAVLECEFPDGVAAAPYLISSTEPSNLYEWASAGFAAVGAKDDTVPPTPLNGKVHSAGTDPCRTESFELEVQSAAGQAADWQGASGSPVFVGQRILGVVASAQRPFEGRRLTATATCRLLHDESFREAIGYVEKWKHLEDYRARLIGALWDKRRAASKNSDDVQRLADAMKAAERLALEMGLDPRERWHGEEAFARAVVGRLLHERLEDLLPRLTATRRALVEAGEVNSAEVAKKIAFLVMPAVCDVGEVDPSDWLGSGPALVRLPAATETLAEIILAAADRRAARFDRGGTRPEPRLRLQPPPSGGETTSLARFEEQWRAYVIQKFVDARDRAKAAQHETLTKLANVVLDSHFRLRKERYYCIVEMADPGEAVYWEAIVARLRRDYPAVVFVTLLGTDDDLLRECFLRVHIDELLAPDDGEAAS